MLVSFLKVGAGAILLAGSGAALPNYSIAKMCQADANTGLSGNYVQSCLKDEKAALDDLRKRWSKVSTYIRTQCTTGAGAIAPSYVDLSGCIDNYVGAQELEKANKTGVPLSTKAPKAPAR